ncbi:MAG: copper homeostasis protein CutC [Oscillospiraceae bacterium]|nr:copper homeostasis protein CutC [Oscillospiraceae bacterium]
MKKYLLEICVDSFESARRASENGADRLELCGDLLVGGVSPSPFLIEQVVERVKTPVNVLLRPRFGDFCFTDEEKEVLLKEIEFCAKAGVNGVVIGALTPEGDLDVPFLSRCMAAAADCEVTLHRCFDVCRDPFEAIDTACDLGIQTILTSGQMATAPKGLENLKAFRRFAADRIHLMAGSGVSAANIPTLHREAGICHFHLSAKQREPGPMKFVREGVPMGLPMASEFDRQYASPAAVRAARAAVDSLN